MKLTDTRVTSSGVFRCCVETVATEYLDGDGVVAIGATSKCKHCDREFTLVDDANYYVWLPTDK
jgi:hypothetical protein